MRFYAIAVYVFLYFPIAIIVAYSFNEGRYAMDWQGFSFQWYAAAWNNPLVMEALETSLIIAGGTAIISVIVGTAAALGLERLKSNWIRQIFDGLIYIAIIVPGIVIGIATLVACVTVFDLVNPLLAAIFGEDCAKTPARHLDGDRRARAVQPCRRRARGAGAAGDARQEPDRSRAGSLRHALRHLSPGPASAPAAVDRCRRLLAFTFSLDDYIITSFVAGPYSTLPIYVFASIRRGVTPEINAIGTVILLTSFSLTSDRPVADAGEARKRRP